MSYNKRTWANGNVVGAVDLNRMEQGIEDASDGGTEILIANMTSEGSGHLTFDKTWQEIHDAFLQGKICFLMANQASGHILRTLLVTSVAEEIYEVDGADVTVYIIQTNDSSYDHGEMAAPNDYVQVWQES